MICKTCNSTETQLFHVREMMKGNGEVFTYQFCGLCQTLTLIDPPADPAKYYDDYYTEKKSFYPINNVMGTAWRLRCRLSLLGFFPLIRLFAYNTMLDWCNRIKKIRLDSAILDVGCGNGDILFEFSKHGFTNLTGVDLFPPEITDTSFKWKFIKGEISEVTCQKFDLIMFHHSLEHMTDHEQVLSKARDLLKPSGAILVRIPVINKPFWDYLENWVQIDAPRHVKIHSVQSFKELCGKLELTVDDVFFDSTDFQFLGSEENKRNIPHNDNASYKKNRENSIFSEADFLRFENSAKQYNREGLGDQAGFIIRVKK
jgi:SAM-dependent methyltransferase